MAALSKSQRQSQFMFKIAQTALSGGRRLQRRGSLERRANMDQFIQTQNVERYRRLLARVSEKSDRQTILSPLAQEQQKQRDAGDPLH